VDNIILRCFFNESKNYSIAEFELYAADSREKLYDTVNRIAHVRGIDDWHSGTRNNADWLFDVVGAFRFFGIKVLKANGTDDITRLGFIGVYSAEATENIGYINRNFPNSIIAGKEPTVLTCGDLLDGVEISGQKTFNFTLEEPRTLSEFWILADNECEIYTRPASICEIVKKEKFEHRLKVQNSEKLKEFSITVTGNTTLYLMGASASKASAEVDFRKVINDNFYGVGVNVLPMSFMPENMSKGYNEVYWRLEETRIFKTGAHIARVWFQPDWLVETYDEYKSGNYNFDAPKMYSVYKYLDALKAAGIEVEFNFGWKVSRHAQSWFSFEGTSKKSNSAPRELDLFAKCCGETMFELINRRGYDNIKYLTFYNEPEYGKDAPDYGDFIVIGEKRMTYWHKMLELCCAALKDKNLDYLKIWGTEGGMQEWMEYYSQNCRHLLDVQTVHRYEWDCDMCEKMLPEFLKWADGMPVIMSECGQVKTPEDMTWRQNHIQLFSQIANLGFSGMFVWCLNSMYITDPCSFTMRNGYDFWDIPYYSGGINNVREPFYELAMLCRYVPNHCQVVKSEVTEGKNSLRVSAFKFGDDYTIVVETAGDITNIEIKLPEAINRRFGKHIHRRPHNYNGNATIPPRSGEMFVGDTLKDTVYPEYTAIVYTTLPAVPQIEAAATEIYIEAGEKVRIPAAIIDGFGKVDYELSVATADSFLFSAADETVEALDTAESGDMCAVTLRSVNHPEAENVVIVKVK